MVEEYSYPSVLFPNLSFSNHNRANYIIQLNELGLGLKLSLFENREAKIGAAIAI
jgi:hypothetical protein